MKRAGKYILWGLAVWFLGHTIYSAVDGMVDRGETADYAVILGSAIEQDGSLSDRLAGRMKCGLKLYKEGRVRGIIVSGGRGSEGFYEGSRISDFLRARGVPDSVIVVDNDGGNTRKGVENTLALRDSLGFDSLIVVTQYYNVTRAKMFFRREGFKNISSSAPVYFELRDLYYVPREFVAYYTQIW